MISFQVMPENTKTAVVRMYSNPFPAPMEPYQVVCTANWESPTVVWVHGLKGDAEGSWKIWRKLIASFKEQGVRTIKANRADGKRLPRAVYNEEGGYYEIDLEALQRTPRRPPKPNCQYCGVACSMDDPPIR